MPLSRIHPSPLQNNSNNNANDRKGLPWAFYKPNISEDAETETEKDTENLIQSSEQLLGKGTIK
jgi:hypothetical protein